MTAKTIQKLEEYVKALNRKDLVLFERFFSVQTSIARIKLASALREKMKGQFKISEIEKQPLVRVDNLWTNESTIYNSLRKKRPEQKAQGNIDLLAKDVFCSPFESTPEDEIGRMEGKFVLTASNLAKYNRHHSLIIFKKHDPHSISFEAFREAVSFSFKWFEKIHDLDGDANYPFLLWNYLWRAGASIIHPHFQVLLSPKAFPSQYLLEDARRKYFEQHNGDYLDDFSLVHEHLGLGFKWKGISILAHLVPIKEQEILCIGNPGEYFFSALYKIASWYQSQALESFDMAFIMPPLHEKDKRVVARFVDRGSLAIATADFGAMEIYSGSHVVSSDPYKLIKGVYNIFK